MQLSHNRARSSPEIVFLPDGSGTPIHITTLVKYLGVQTDNMFSPSAQCTEAANKAKRLIFIIRRSFQDLSKSGFIPLFGALVRPHLEYGMPACSPNLVAEINHLEWIQRLATRLITGMRHRLYEEKLQRLGLRSLQRQRLRVDLITVFKIFKSLLDIDPNLLFLPPARRGLRGHPFKVLQGASRLRWRGSEVSLRVVKYWNKLPASVVAAPSLNVFKKRLEEVWTEVFPHLPH